MRFIVETEVRTGENVSGGVQLQYSRRNPVCPWVSTNAKEQKIRGGFAHFIFFRIAVRDLFQVAVSFEVGKFARCKNAYVARLSKAFQQILRQRVSKR
jgi:hypothetical protein